MLIALFTVLTSVAQVQAPGTAQPAGKREWRELACDGGVVLRYAVVTPAGFDAQQPHPVLLAIPGGNQDQAQVENNLDMYWQSQAIAREWVVVAPIAPGAKLFFQGSEAFLPPDWALLNALWMPSKALSAFASSTG